MLRLPAASASAHFFSQYNKIATAALSPYDFSASCAATQITASLIRSSGEAAYAVCDILTLTRVRVGKDIPHVRQRAGMGDRRQIANYEAYQKREG